MINWDLYETRVLMNGNNKRERSLNDTKVSIQNTANKLINTETIIINGKDKLPITIFSTKQDSIKRFTSSSEKKINVGDIIELDNWVWLVTSIDNNFNIYQKGIIRACNFNLQYQNHTSDVLSQSCVLTDTYSEVDSSGKIISTSLGKTVILIPYNSNTKKLYKDKRIMTETVFNKNNKEIGVVFKISGFDSKFKDYGNGKLIYLTIESDTYNNSTDNKELMICDYISPDSPPLSPVNPSVLKCEIKGRTDIKIGGSTRTYEAVFYNPDDVIDNSITPIWELEYNPLYRDYIICEQNGDLINIKCLDVEDLIGEKIILKLKDKNGLYQNQLDIECVVM